MASSSDHHRHLREDVLMDILSRLPVKPLLQFKCVCKQWYARIKSPIFIAKHLHHHSNRARLLVHHFNHDTEKYAFALFPDETLAGAPPLCQDLYLQTPRCPSGIFGPLNGLFCLFNGLGRVALWNPATREFKPFPIPHPDLEPQFRAYGIRFGFGLDPLTNSYKVILIRNYWDEEEDDPYYPSVVSVYTLGTDSWRHFEDAAHLNSSRNLYNSLCNTYLDGTYYWRTDDDDYDNRILSFDMGNEVFQEIKAPPISASQLGDLGLYNDSLAMFVYCVPDAEKRIDIWVMGEVGCWTKQVTIGPLPEIEGPLGFWKNGEVFLETSTSQLVLYDPSTREIRDLGPQGSDNCLKVFMYKESMISVNSGNEDQEEDNSFDLALVRDFFESDH